MTGSLLLRKEKIDHPSCSDALKPNRIHISQSKLKDFCCFFGVLSKGWGAGRDSFQFCIKTKFTHVFSSIVIASVLSAAGLRSLMLWVWRLVGEVDGDLGMSYSKHKARQPFFSTPRQAAVRDSMNTLQCTGLQMIFPLFCVMGQFQPTENSWFVNWRFLLCLTELKFRSLCLIYETKGNNMPTQK